MAGGQPPSGPVLDGTDLEIFRELQRDGRAPFVALAGRLGVSEAHVRRRVAHLIEADVFSITAVADPKVLGIQCMAWLALNVHDARAAAVAEQLAGEAEIDYVVQTAGAFNVMAEAVCRSSSDLYQLLRRVRGIPGVRRIETSVYLNLLRQQFQWSLDGARGAVHGDGGAVVDALDTTLIREFQRDGRASFREVGKRLGVSERTVSARVSGMVERNILQIIAVGNPATLGFSAMSWLGIRVGHGARVEEVATALADVSGIDYVVIPTGRYDVMAELVCRDHDELLRTLETGVGAIDGIDHVESFVYLRLLYKSAIGAWGASRAEGVGDT